MLNYTRLTKVFFVFIAGVVLCFMGFYNRFPLLYPDSGTYIGSGWTGYVPNDRPIFYGLFLRHASLGDSLFLAIFVQGLIVALLSYFWFKYFNSSKRKLLIYLSFIFLITFLTGASLNVSQLIPDIFAATMIMSLILILFAPGLSWRDGSIISLLLVLSIVVHNSHIYIVLLCILGYCGLLLFKSLRPYLLSYKVRLKRTLLAFGLLLFSIVSIPSVHYFYGGGFMLSKGSQIFMMGRLLQLGIATKYLQDVCPEKGYKFCDHLENIPVNFLWDTTNSPLYKTGGWEANEEEYDAIIKDILTTPRYLSLFILRSLEATFQQFFHFDLGDTTIKQHKESSPYKHFERFLPDQTRNYEVSMQYNNQLNFDLANVHQRYLLGIGLLLSILLLSTNLIANEKKIMIGFLMICLLANAAICGSLSGVLFRYQCRVMWLVLLPLFVVLCDDNILKKVNSFIRKTP
ncbi:MAG: hypothetical protein DHS20C18_18840 [Saprospiraceae bacterium]|nr:MAG: hypothetical protein DHS20C18_18840 [Saprospiraceae bacterium]